MKIPLHIHINKLDLRHRMLAIGLSIVLVLGIVVPVVVLASDNDAGGGLDLSIEGLSLGLSVEVSLADSGSVPWGSGASSMSLTEIGSVNFRDQLDGHQRQVYDQLAAGLLPLYNGTFDITMQYPWIRTYAWAGLHPTEVERQQLVRDAQLLFQPAVDALKRDYPELYWLDVEASTLRLDSALSGEAGAVVVTVTAFYYSAVEYAGSSPLDQMGTINQQLNAIVSTARAAGSSRYAQVKSVHDQLAARISYYDGDPYPIQHEISGALILGSAVCEGYAKSFKLALDQLGVPCVLVSGVGYGGGGAQPHMWNYVKMEDGRWYGVDVTWDDQATLRHDYFLAGAGTVAPNFGGRTFDESHVEDGDFSGTGMQLFGYPMLNATAYEPGADEIPHDADESYFTIVPPAGASGWHNDSFSVVPTNRDGYSQVSRAAGGEFSGSVRVTEETAGSTATLYFSDGTTVTSGYPLSYRMDRTAPTLVSAVWRQDGDTPGVLVVTAYDNLSGISDIIVLGPDGEGLASRGDNSFVLTGSGEHQIILTDRAGNRAVFTHQVEQPTMDGISIVDAAGRPVAAVSGYRGQELALGAAVSGSAGLDESSLILEWASDNTQVATVDQSGRVSVRAFGVAEITVSAMGMSDSVTLYAFDRVAVNQSGDGGLPSVQIPDGSLPEGVAASELYLVVGPALADVADSLNAAVAAEASFADMRVEQYEIELQDGTGRLYQPQGEMTITLPYPGDSGAGYTFAVLHVHNGAGVMLGCEATAEGVRFRVDGLSPFAVGYRANRTGGTASSGSGSSGGTSVSDGTRRDSFWSSVLSQILGARSGDVVKLDVRPYTAMPTSVLLAAQNRDITLAITWNSSGEQLAFSGLDLDFLDESYISYSLEGLALRFSSQGQTGVHAEPGGDDVQAAAAPGAGADVTQMAPETSNHQQEPAPDSDTAVTGDTAPDVEQTAHTPGTTAPAASASGGEATAGAFRMDMKMILVAAIIVVVTLGFVLAIFNSREVK